MKAQRSRGRSQPLTAGVLVAAVALVAGCSLGGGGADPPEASGSCAPTICVSVDTSAVIGPADRAAQGFLHSLYPTGQAAADFDRLRPTMWRSFMPFGKSGGGTVTVNATWRWGIPAAAHVPTTLIVSDEWYQQTHGRITPWSDWNAYTTWLRWLVGQVQASGTPVDYFEVFNEPDQLKSYYSKAAYATVTPTRLLQQFLVTYRTVRALEPRAHIIGPSLSAWSDHGSSRGFGMVGFLDFAAANHLALAAVSWHFFGADPGKLLPQVAEARRLVADRPALGHPAIFINEYGAGENYRIPGWDVAYLAAITASRVDSAGRTCYDDCWKPTLDGLLSPDGKATLPDYWVRVAYAAMTGTMVSATSNDTHVSAVAAYDPSTSTVALLVGRGVSCRQDPRCFDGGGRSAARPASITVALPAGWSGGQVTVTETDIAGNRIRPTGPPPVTWSGPVVPVPSSGHAVVQLPIASFGDGDAWSVVLTHRA